MLPKTVASILAFGSASLVLAQKSGPHPVTGVEVRNGSYPIRRNIDDLVSEKGPQLDLYIQALNRMHEAKSSEYNSFFQVGGIHHWPHIPWDNGKAPTDRDRGYCPHGEPIFLSWHRPYVILFEQILVGHAKEIAAEYPEDSRSKYEEAAEVLRTPYWDWGIKTAVPEISTQDSITVQTSTGQKEVRNPLFSYKFPSEALNGEFGDMSALGRLNGDQSQTVRCPAPQSYPQSANLALRRMSSRNGLRPMVYDIFTNSKSLPEFASTQVRGMSLEQIHNSIHEQATCGADLFNMYMSGFEPLFMLHHAQIDRLWAYWQAIHPKDSYEFQPYPGQARFTSPQGTIINTDSPLEPFYTPDGKPYTTKTVASIYAFGYAYEGLEGGPSDKSTAGKAATLINELYSGNGSGKKKPSPPTKPKPDGPTSGTTPGSPGPSNSPPRPGDDSRPGRNGTTSSTRLSGRPSTTNSGSRPTGTGLPVPGDEPDGSDPTPSGDDESSRGPTRTPSPDGEDGQEPTGTPSPDGEDGPENEGDDTEDEDDGQRHYAQIELDVEQLDRPCLVHVYVGSVYANSLTVMGEPSQGKFHGAVYLNSAINQFKSQPKNGDSGNSTVGNGTSGNGREFYNNIHIDIAKRNGTRIDLNMVDSLKVEVDQINVTPPTSVDKLPTVEFLKPKPANDGAKLTLPPSTAKNEAGPNLDSDAGQDGYDQGGDQGSNQGGNGGQRPKNGPKSAATTVDLHMLLAVAPLAVSAILSIF